MTYEEAIEKISWTPLMRLENEHGELKEALTMAIEALEKQVPKKKHKYMGFRCICGKEVAKNQAYCEYCGQALLDLVEVTE